MAGLDEFNIVAGLIGILSFVFAVWVWMKSNIQNDELLKTIETIYMLACNVIWESQITLPEDTKVKIKQAEKALGFVTSIQQIAGQYIRRKVNIAISDMGLLIERGIIWTATMMWDIEKSELVTEIWVITPDLKPDSSDRATGKGVHRNLENGKKYVYFYPENLPHSTVEIERLLHNIRLTKFGNGIDSKYKEKVILIPVSQTMDGYLFSRGNVVLFFFDSHRNLLPRCFEEIVLTKIDARASFWQEHTEEKTNEFRYLFEEEFKKAILKRTI